MRFELLALPPTKVDLANQNNEVQIPNFSNEDSNDSVCEKFTFRLTNSESPVRTSWDANTRYFRDPFWMGISSEAFEDDPTKMESKRKRKGKMPICK